MEFTLGLAKEGKNEKKSQKGHNKNEEHASLILRCTYWGVSLSQWGTCLIERYYNYRLEAQFQGAPHGGLFNHASD